MHQIFRPLGLIWSDLSENKLFLIGLLFKLALIIAIVPSIQQQWFVPFLESWIEDPTSLPWSGYLLSGGDPLAFPYGFVMFIWHLPTTAVGWLMDYFFTTKIFSSIGFKLSLLGADILLLLIILQIYERYWKKILIFYWLSPIVIFITYWHGQTDIIPIALFIFSLALLKRGNYLFSGIVLACSIAAKHSMIIGAPFIIIYLWSHNGANKEIRSYLSYLLFSLFVIEFPFFLSDAFRMMVLDNREVEKLYWFFIQMDNDKFIFLTPLVYLLLLYFFWRIRRVNFELLFAFLGVAFSVVILLTPSPPGWYLWMVPIFTLHQSRYGLHAVALIGAFSLLFITYHLIHTSGASSILFDLPKLNMLSYYNPFIQSLHYTMLFGLGVITAIQILREGVKENDYYRLGNKPLVLGIAGNSGVGKTTFSKGLAMIFGERTFVEVSGDDYHNWERSSPMWKTLTHLDPKANRLFDLVKDVQRLLDGRVVKARRYNHKTGRFLPKSISKSKDVIVVEGLHTLYPKQLLQELNVSFFIEMDEFLRQYFRIQRDTSERGHDKKAVLIENENRKADFEKYIKPQAKRANVIFSILLNNEELFKQEQIIDSNLKLKVCIRNGIYYQELVRVLIGVCGLQVNIDSVDERGEVVLEISGDVVSEDIKLAVNMLVPHMDELLDFSCKFSDGVNGIMELITVMEIDEALKLKRL